MKREENTLHKFESLSDFHRVFELPKPVHPLISFIDIKNMKIPPKEFPHSIVLDFYKIAYKTNLCGKAKYGQNYYDFGEGGLVFTAPGQIFETPESNGASGYLLLIHPDFFLSYPLAKNIRQYGFFSYTANEALHLSDNERTTIMSIFSIIDDELNSRIDDFSQDIVISQVELLLNYSNRFYKRQFITRKAANSDLLQKLEEILDDYFNNEKSLRQGIPTVQYLSEHLNISASYLSDMLRSFTGQNAQQHIHNKLVEKAKEKLSISNLSVSEIAYQLGFEYPQSFSRLFKTKTNLSPLEFRQSFK
ncbi:helix-turn-helix domain-containing protein [Chitinophaga oryziterrae]|uniref:Helix-turn-helix domain-containing protein n=1 Tax=Chitinophaga oryziterrae TaxID=1031224 RepID=A0A6N8JGK1_9BACT|nr:response regulator transcription factor [Chitinophaga oryziterrae]MVT43282.1 helix-turn-helix domain-containing protein [Chitinophaga oryziterrae]